MVGKMKSSIIIIEDDENLSRELNEFLTEEGYSVKPVFTGKDALSTSKKHRFHLAIIDLRLPDMNGTSLLDKLPEGTPPIKKVILTGYPDMDSAIRAVNLGADVYLVKPVDPNRLLKVVKKQLEKMDEEREVTQDNINKFIKSRISELEDE
jgi:DNA-binding NtrC family response regulator